MPIKNKFQAPRLGSFHAIAALRGDGLHPELLKLFERLTKGADTNLSQSVEGLLTDFASKDVAPDLRSAKKF